MALRANTAANRFPPIRWQFRVFVWEWSSDVYVFTEVINFFDFEASNDILRAA